MTYFEIVNRIKDIVFRHKMLVDFGYGNLSDIKSVAQNFDVNGISDTGRSDQSADTDYPYVFVNPQSHQRTQQAIKYRFNIIVMDQAKNAFEVLKVQSDCQQYIDDIISELRFDYKDAADVILNVSLTPFKERFQDTVAGMTATLEIEVANAINNCIAPVYPRLTETEVYVTHEFDQVLGPEPGDNTSFQFTNVIENDGGWSINRYTTPGPGIYSFVLEYSFQFEELQPGETFPSAPFLQWRPAAGGFANIPANDIIGWPSTPEVGVTYTVKQQWLYLDYLSNGDLEFLAFSDVVGQPEGLVNVNAGASLKIYKA